MIVLDKPRVGSRVATKKTKASEKVAFILVLSVVCTANHLESSYSGKASRGSLGTIARRSNRGNQDVMGLSLALSHMGN